MRHATVTVRFKEDHQVGEIDFVFVPYLFSLSYPKREIMDHCESSVTQVNFSISLSSYNQNGLLCSVASSYWQLEKPVDVMCI